jgi:hypothetical protein
MEEKGESSDGGVIYQPSTLDDTLHFVKAISENDRECLLLDLRSEREFAQVRFSIPAGNCLKKVHLLIQRTVHLLIPYALTRWSTCPSLLPWPRTRHMEVGYHPAMCLCT